MQKTSLKGNAILLILLILLLSSISTTCVFKDRSVSFKGIKFSTSAFDSIVRLPVDHDGVVPIDLRKGLKEATIDRRRKVLEMLDMVDEISLFFPETTDSSIIGIVSKVIRAGDRVFILDNEKSNALFVFDRSGAFMYTIGNVGNGPGEFVEATDFEVDEAEDRLYIYDQYRSMVNRYDLLGHYLGYFKLPFRSTGMVKLGNAFVFQNLLQNDHIKAIQKSALTVTDTSGQVMKVGLTMLRYNFISDRIVRFTDSMAHHMIPYNDTVYHVTPDGLFARYVFVFPESNRLPKDFMKRTGPMYERFRELYPSNSFTYYESGCWETTTHLMAKINHGVSYCTILYCKQSSKALVVPGFFNSEDISMESVILMLNKPVSGDNNQFVIPVYASYLMDNVEDVFSNKSANEKEKWIKTYPALRNWGSDDNPIICFLRFKSFVLNTNN